MRIAILGAGNVGGTLGKAWAARGHEVFFGVRHPQDGKVQEVLKACGPKAKAGTAAEAAAFGEVVVLATPWPATREAVQSAGDLAGKVVIDCTNPLTPDFSALALGHNTSGGELVAGWAKGAKVYKAFNQAGFLVMANPTVGGRKTVMFVCGEDGPQKKTVLRLVEEVGFEAIDAGDLSVARLLEPLAMLWIHLALKRGMGPDFAFTLARR